MRYFVLSAAMLAIVLNVNQVAASARYKYVGAPFSTATGCLATHNHIAMTLIIDKPIAAGKCSDGTFKSWKFSDGVNSGVFTTTYLNAGEVLLCKNKSGKIDYYNVSAELPSAAGKVEFSVQVIGVSPVINTVQDTVGACLPASSGSSGVAGKWIGP